MLTERKSSRTGEAESEGSRCCFMWQRARHADSAPPRQIHASIGTTAGEDGLFLGDTEPLVLGRGAGGRHDSQPSSDQAGPLRGREERCSQRHLWDHVWRQSQEGESPLIRPSLLLKRLGITVIWYNLRKSKRKLPLFSLFCNDNTIDLLFFASTAHYGFLCCREKDFRSSIKYMSMNLIFLAR